MTDRIDLSLRIDAPPADVWRAWTEPEHLAQWLPDRARGNAVPGRTMTYEWEALGMSLELDVVDALPPSRLVLSAQPPGLERQTQTIVLAPYEQGTVVSLTHTGFTDDDIRRGTESGWRISLQLLRHYLEHHFGVPRLSAWMLGLVSARFEDVYRMYATPTGLQRWLAESGSIGEPGDRYELELIDGGTMSGRVLARCEGREIALSWDEVEGAVALRAFAAAPGALLVGANLSSWGVPESALVAPAKVLEASIDRLVRALGGSSASA